MTESDLLRSLAAAVESNPGDVALRLHLARLLLDADDVAAALRHVSTVLAQEPGSTEAARLAAEAAARLGTSPEQPARPAPAGNEASFDWESAEQDVGDIAVPATAVPEHAVPDGSELPPITFADVGGMEQVKRRLHTAFLGPLANPEMREAYGKTLRGGLLLYGPPGCGKTFIARATAGQLGARFFYVGLNDVLDMWLGNSERNLHEIFEAVRRNSPCVLFLDEIDALGQKRSHMVASAMRGTVTQLLTELDNVQSRNEGVFVLAATNHPWDVDTALRRPGRLDRMLLVLPPDEPARQVILEVHLRDRPVDADLTKVARKTDGYSGADLAHLCDTATEHAMEESIARGGVRPVSDAHLAQALKEVRPSTGPWFSIARNVAMFANEDGQYDDLLAYLRSRRLV